MQGRTFFRVAIDLLFDNVIVRTITSFVNFCNEQKYYNQKELKFLTKVPINNVGQNNYNKQQHFVFNSVVGQIHRKLK